MIEFFQSKFAQDLQNGKLPPVEVKFSTESLVQVAATAVIAAVIIIIVGRIARSI